MLVSEAVRILENVRTDGFGGPGGRACGFRGTVCYKNARALYTEYIQEAINSLT